jgi:hypothetical protein
VSDNSFSDDFFDRWEHLISSVEISDVPIRFIKQINAVFKNGTNHSFDVKNMLKKGYNFQQIEKIIEIYLEQYDNEIESVDFHLNINAIADEVEDKTNKLLDI